MFYKTTVIADGSSTLPGIGMFGLFAPVTLTLTRWPSYTNLTKYELLPSRLSKVIVWQRDRETDKQTHPKLHSIPLRRWSNVSPKTVAYSPGKKQRKPKLGYQSHLLYVRGERTGGTYKVGPQLSTDVNSLPTWCYFESEAYSASYV